MKNDGIIVLKLLKDYEKEYNANNLAKEVGITSMGVLKILKRLEKDEILKSKEAGKAVFYKINIGNEYAQKYILFLLQKELQESSPIVKRWINEIKGIKNAQIALLFGSILSKGKNAHDIDVLFVTNENNFSGLKKEIAEKDKISIKKIHPVFQTMHDFRQNIKNRDKIVVNAIKSGLIVYGHEKMIEMMKNIGV
jgi:predicted transcriptional regulator